MNGNREARRNMQFFIENKSVYNQTHQNHVQSQNDHVIIIIERDMIREAREIK
jgi:hypothetical protein